MRIKVRLFGAFRGLGGNSGNGSELELELSHGARISDLRAALARVTGNEALVADSAFASEARVLQDSAELAPGTVVAVLPPVCGG